MTTTIRATKPAILIASLLLAAGVTATGPAAAMADDTVQGRGAALPTSIVNGDFEYLGDRILSQATDAYNFANVDYVHGQASTFSSQGGSWFDIAGFDADAFGWKSTQTDTSVDGRAPIVEIQQSHDRSNAYAEITASQAGTAIYQDISTPVPGTVYTISLKHASRTFDGHDALSVMIGAPGKETPVELTRTASDAGDPVGETSTNVESTAFAWNNEWDTYEGTYTIPAGQPITRFTFRSVRGTEGGLNESVAGNNVDDISFQISYPLAYALNGGQGATPNEQ